MAGIIDERIKKIDQEIGFVEKLKRLLKYAGEDRIIDSHEKRKLIEEANKDKAKIEIKSDIPTLDSFFDGFRVGTLNVLSGPTGEGKTSFLQTLTMSFTRQNIKCVWFPFEGIMAEFFDKFQEMPVFYLPKEIPENKNTIEWVKDRIWEAKAKYDTRVVFLDHLHYFKEMQGAGASDQLSLYIGDIMRSLKKFAIEAEVAIFLIVHTKSDAGTVNSRHIYYTKDDIRDSSFVKQEADSVIMIYRGRKKTDLNDAGWEYTNQAILNVDKNRRTGKVGFVKLSYEHGKFTELEQRNY